MPFAILLLYKPAIVLRVEGPLFKIASTFVRVDHGITTFDSSRRSNHTFDVSRRTENSNLTRMKCGVSRNYGVKVNIESSAFSNI
jgi:hypothetical protein